MGLLSGGFLAYFLTVFGGEVNWRGYAQTSFQIRAQRIFGAVPLGLQENAKGGEAWTQLATLKQVSTLLQRILCEPRESHAPKNQSPGSESWSVLCTGGSAGAALCVEDVAVLRGRERNKQCCIIVVYCAVVLTVGSRMRGFYIFYSKYV